MKLTAIVLFLISLEAWSEEKCSTVWVYRPYLECTRPENGVDVSKPGTRAGWTTEWSEPAAANESQDACAHARDRFNARYQGLGLWAELDPTGLVVNEQVIHIGRVARHRFECGMQVSIYPFKNRGPICGTEDRWIARNDVPPENLPGHAMCLTCDDLEDAPVDARSTCLRRMITEVIQPGAVPLSKRDLSEFELQVALALEDSRRRRDANREEDVRVFQQFLGSQFVEAQ